MEQNSKSQVQVDFVIVVVDVVANKWKWNELVNAYGGRDAATLRSCDVAALKELFDRAKIKEF